MSKNKILIVDDEENILKMLDKKLNTVGYKTILAKTGAEAFKLIKSEKPDLILMDIMLPDMSGAEVVQQLQGDPTTINIPLIFLSGIVSKRDDQMKGKKSEVRVGQMTYSALGKPFPFEELLTEIKDVLS